MGITTSMKIKEVPEGTLVDGDLAKSFSRMPAASMAASSLSIPTILPFLPRCLAIS